MDAGQRVNAIRETATVLASQPWPDIDLVLDQFGAPTVDIGDWDGPYGYVVEMLRSVDDDVLVRLHQYVTGQATTSRGLEPWQQGRLRLFVSHLYSQREIAGQIKTALALYGIDAFVAHDSIEPSLEWREVIDAALRSCDAAVALLHDGFHESNWTDHEVGYLLALRVPILPLVFDLDPYGFLAKYQGRKCASMTGGALTELIVRWLKQTPSTAASFADGLVSALENAGSFNMVRQILPLVEELPSLSPDQLRRLEAAARSNVNVKDGNVGWQPAPARIQALVARHNPAALATSDERPF